METRRVALISYRTDSGRRVASGLLVDERSVLTTDHVAAGHGHRVECGGAVSEVQAVFRSGTLEVDLAVLRLSTPVPGVVRIGCARVDQSRAGEVRDCVAVGFPRWKSAAGQRPSAQVTGTVPTAEGLRSSGGSGLRPGFLTLVAGRIVGAPNVERGDFDASPWAGMSGAGVVAGDLIIGVVRSHNLAEGPQSLTVTPLTAIDLLPAGRGRPLWEALGVTDSSWLPVLPQRAPYAVNQPGRLRLPELPPGLVSRDALVGQAVAAFLDRLEPIVALTGFGGVGKTTLARQILWRQELRSRWPGGVLWLSIGQQPDLPGLIATACVDLTGAAVGVLSVTDLAAWLRDDLARRRALLVLDDVWDGEAIEPLLGATSGIPRLITTRDDRWLDPWTAQPIEVGMLEQAEAYRLLAAGLGTGTEPPAELHRLIDRLGRWPLLMGLAVGYLRTRLRRGATAAVALAEMTDRYEALGVTAFDDRRAADLDQQQDRSRAVRLTLEASMRLLGDPDRERYRALTVFPAGLPIPMDLVADVWAPQLDRYGTQDLLDQLVGLSLLNLDYGAREVQLHEVLRDYLAPPPADQAAAHRKLIERWGSPYQLQDKYRVEWYSYHLRAASDDQALYDLITPQWRDHVLAVTRSLSSVAGDVRRAAEQAAAAHRLGEEVRCHLIRTRLMTSSGAVPLAALSAFTRLGDPDRALGYADLRPAEQRDDAVLQIVVALAPRDWRAALTLAEGRLTNPVPLAMALGAVAEAAAGEHPAEATDLVTRAIATADAIADPGPRGDAILSLIGPAASIDPDLAESLAGRAERRVGWGSFEVDTPAGEFEQWRQLALGALVRALAAGDPARAASLAETITESFGRASALTALASAAAAAQPDRADALLAEAAALARQLRYPGNTASLLAQIAAVPTGQADAYAAEAATVASAATHSEFFGWVRTGDELLAGTASVLAHSHPRLALDLAEKIDPSGWAGTEVKARVLATIADAMAGGDPSGAREVLERALTLSQSAEHLYGDITAVAEVAADLAQVDIRGFRVLIGQARQMAGGLASQFVRSEALAEIAAAVIGVAGAVAGPVSGAADAELIELALQVSSQIELPHFKTEALAGIVRALAVTDVSQALAVADLIDDSDASQRTRAELLAELTDRLAATDIWGAARMAAGIDDRGLRSHRLVHLATLLAPRDLEGCWRLLSDVDLPRWYRPGEPLMELVSAVAAVDVARAVTLASRFYRNDYIDALARIARVDRAAAEAAVPRIDDAFLEEMTMEHIAVEAAKAAAATDADQALAIAQQIADEERRAETLAAISAIMSDAGNGRAGEIAATAKQAADRHPDWDSRDIYAAIVPVLAPAEVSQAVDAALHLPGVGFSDDPRAHALGQIARTHPRQALEASDQIPEADERWQALARIAEVTGQLDTRRTAALIAEIDMPGTKDEAFTALVRADPMLALQVADADAESRLDYLLGIAWLASEMTNDLAEGLLSRVDDAQEKERLRRAIVIASGKNAPKAVAQDRLRHLLPLVDGDPDETWPVVRALVATITEPDQAASMAAAICSAMAW